MDKQKGWNFVEKLFDWFPFRVLTSGVIGAIAYAITPNNYELLIKFGVFWYIFVSSLISFLAITFIIWLKDSIVRKVNETNTISQNIEKARIDLYNITDKLSEADTKVLRKMVESGNEPYRVEGNPLCLQGLFASNFIHSKIEYDKTRKTEFKPPFISNNDYTLYWLDEKFYNLCRLILEKYGKISRFDKGEK